MTEMLRTESATSMIDRIVEAVPGWSPADELLALYTMALATAHITGDVLEIGSWCGRSTAVLGHAVRVTGRGNVHAIDPFPTGKDWYTNPDGSHSFSMELEGISIGGYQDQTVWDEPFQDVKKTVYNQHESPYDIFKTVMSSEGLSDVVKTHRGTSSMFASKAPDDTKVRMAFIDGDHSYESVCNDIANVEKYLQIGGWIAFDDAFTVYEGVNAAIVDKVMSSGRYESGQQICRKMFAAKFLG